MFSTVFSESRVLPQKKKQPFGFTKKAKSQTEKTPNCHKTKTRMKEKKNRQNNVSHHILTHPIEALLHTHTNSPNFILKYHPCHQINQSTKPPILDFYSSLIAVPKH